MVLKSKMNSNLKNVMKLYLVFMCLTFTIWAENNKKNKTTTKKKRKRKKKVSRIC